MHLVIEHRCDYETEYAAIRSIAAKLGIVTAEMRRHEVDTGPTGCLRSAKCEVHAGCGGDPEKRAGREASTALRVDLTSGGIGVMVSSLVRSRRCSPLT